MIKKRYDDKPKSFSKDRPPYGDKPKTFAKDRPAYGDKPERSFGGKPERTFGDKPERSFGGKPERTYGDKPERLRDEKPERLRDEKPRSNYDHKPRNASKERVFADKPKSFSKERPYGDKPKPFSKDRPFEDDEFADLYLEGRNVVLEALNNERTIDKIMTKKGEVDGTLRSIIALAREKGIVTQEVEKNKLDYISQTGNHQGIIAICPAHEYSSVAEILERAEQKDEKPFILILDGITDPHNLGAIIRTADACGVHGVIIPKRRAVGLTAIVSKTAAGALEHVLVARVSNIPSTIDELKRKNIWITAANMGGAPLYKTDLSGAMAIVIGGEGEGLSRLVSEKCDYNVEVPMYGKISSLNASVAAAVLMYEIVRTRNFV